MGVCVEDREREEQEEEELKGEGEDSSTETGSEGEIPVAKLNLQPSVASSASGYDPNRSIHVAPAWTTFCWVSSISPLLCPFLALCWCRYKLHFRRETPEEIEERKRWAQTEPIVSVPEVLPVTSCGPHLM